SNSDPVTGQAAWFDVRVKVYKADDSEKKQTSPQFPGMKTVPGAERRKSRWQAYFNGLGGNRKAS
ncbi:MAG: hypothetical protein DSZ33_00375, partial [Gammaproteobacteria bacterium]